MRCLVVCGAPIGDPAAVKAYIKESDYKIFCDCALRHAEALGTQPELIIGDFDSYEKPVTDIETITLPRAKDDTDSVFAVKEGLRRGCDEFLLIGAVGARFDHSFANISILLMLHSLGKRGMIVDDYSELEVFSGRTEVSDAFPYFSLLNIDGTPHGISVTGAKFPLDNAEILSDYQYGVSNEVLPGQTAVITVREGRLLIVRDRK